ncbi:hypothetical protein SI859A1_01019 [Aurantimonas manganoxydans SI85-9A1]|uniref:Uncharacterized protein n=1 Tax=Aurantimonas manganoxydans (strain ATCC BAA-1229 / DSM 21871 / SI85-9A1) TaxID=287752 RepID=Q1YJI0_AURMS|nr:hypothetical protein SI859A1_01019 [Aurantimonas manganoxydans SI85-9A1]
MSGPGGDAILEEGRQARGAGCGIGRRAGVAAAGTAASGRGWLATVRVSSNAGMAKVVVAGFAVRPGVAGRASSRTCATAPVTMSSGRLPAGIALAGTGCCGAGAFTAAMSVVAGSPD